MRKFFTAALFAVFGLAGAQAQDADLGPAVGSTIPHDLNLQDQTGTERTLADLSGEKGIALFFVRSVDWCPFCQKQVIQVNAYADSFRERGYEPVTLSYDAVEKLGEFARQRDASITLLSDPGSKAIDAFGVRNEAYGEGSPAEGVPHPIVFLIDREGVIKAKLFEEGYRTRPEIDAILGAADGVAGS